ncbi:hypothetical protein KSP39_PZI006103 [Platanthera zijinensis]|uniref:50S ribosomal protein L23, chloroplastic n=1 Tax=Platanthera zijinensis TaxID=2320716 RepID=A0AAP0BUE2_9ASPA
MESNMQNLQKKVFDYWGTINILLMSNQDQLGQKKKHWIELFFGVKVIAMNSHRLPGKGRRMRPILGHTMHYIRMIITLQPGYSIPPLIEKRT